MDAGHPFAVELHATLAESAAAERPAPCEIRTASLRFSGNARLVGDHQEAARIAFGFGGPVLLTTGSRTLAPYVAEARRTGLPVAARVLDHPASRAACEASGLRLEEMLLGRGPFSVADNRAALRALGAAVLVSKDSGEAGGLEAKAKLRVWKTPCCWCWCAVRNPAGALRHSHVHLGPAGALKSDMHLGEGILPALQALAWSAASAPFVLHSARTLQRDRARRPWWAWPRRSPSQ